MKDPVNDSSMHVAELARFATLHCDSVIQSGASLDCPYRGRPPQPWRKKNLESIRCIGQQLDQQMFSHFTKVPCSSILNVSGFAVRPKYAVHRIAA